MKKVWTEHKEKLVADAELKMTEDLSEMADREEQIRLDWRVENYRARNCDLAKDKEAILEFHKKLGVDDVTFNNKVVLHQVDMHLKEGAEHKGWDWKLTEDREWTCRTSKTTHFAKSRKSWDKL